MNVINYNILFRAAMTKSQFILVLYRHLKSNKKMSLNCSSLVLGYIPNSIIIICCPRQDAGAKNHHRRSSGIVNVWQAALSPVF